MRRIVGLIIPVILGCCAVVAIPAVVAAAVEGNPAATERTEMPVRLVVLFSSGVGYFEHGGTVQGNGSTELRFKSAQINDVLKSLVLEDLDGGKIGTIAYPSQDPIEKTLRGFQVDITSNPSLAELLNQLRGASVMVAVHSEQFEGTILGLEKRQKMPAGQSNQIIEEWLLNIMAGAAMRSVLLDDVQKIELRDPELQADLQKALSALSGARNQDKKPVLINFEGNGNRKVRLRYVIETPIWKTSYRLILPQNKGGKPKLQGWAIVENQTDTDWNSVQLSLVSGRPVSFIEDLYKPIYVSRPVVEPELYKGLRPQTYESGMAVPAPAPKRAMKPEQGRAGATAARPDAMFKKHMSADAADEDESTGMEAPFDPSASIVAAASAEKVGELFQYTLGNVSLPRMRSAMFPIMNEDVSVEKVSIFNAEVMPRNPLRGVVLRNQTGKHIMQGPVTVFDGSTYAGDAQVGNLPAGQDRLLSYALDLEVLVDSTKNREENAIQTAKIEKGVLEVSRKKVLSREYTIQNKSDAERTVIVEHLIRPGYKLTSGQAVETTATHYRFKRTIPQGKTESMTVVEEFVRGETIAVLPANLDSLVFYSQSGQIPKNVRETLIKVVEFKRGISDTEHRLVDKRKKLEEIDKEQNRIRSNMGSVNSASQYYSRLLEKLNSQETEVEALQSEVRALEKKQDEQKRELENYLANLTIS